MFDWKPEYSLNITEIDKQHRQLFKLAADLYDIAKLNDGFDHYDDIVKVFKELSDYTVYHFGYEEKLLEKYLFDPQEIKTHKFEHGAFVMKMMKIQQEDLDKNQKKILMDVIMFAVDWIEKHIMQTDKKYSGFLNSQGIN